MSFATVSLCLCGKVDWLLDSGDGERGFDSKVETFNLQLGSPLMVSIYIYNIYSISVPSYLTHRNRQQWEFQCAFPSKQYSVS